MSTLSVLSALNGVWQGVVLAALVALAVRLLPRTSAATTCAVWTATYGMIAALPFIDFTTAHVVTQPAFSASAVRAPERTGARPAPLTVAARSVATPRAATAAPAVGRTDTAVALVFQSMWRTLDGFTGHVARVALACWAVGALVLAVRLIRSYVALLAIKRHAQSFCFAHAIVDRRRGRAAALAFSPAVHVPCAIGFIHPMVVVPEKLAAALDPDDLARVIVHERAHLQRYDDWCNLVERVIGAVLFFHPALHYVARRIAFDREVACDDAVLAVSAEPFRYARCLTDIVELQLRGQRAPAPGFFAGRSQVVARVDRLIEPGRNGSPRVARRAAGVVTAAFVTMCVLIKFQAPLIAAGSHQTPALRGRAWTQARTQVRTNIRTGRFDRTDLLDAVADGTGPQPSVDELVMLLQHGVDGNYVVGMRELVGGKPTPEQFVTLADRGVRPSEVRAFAQLGYGKFTANELVDLADAGVDARYAEHLCQRGMCHLATTDLIKLAQSGVGR